MPDLQWIIVNDPFAEYLLVARPGLLRFGEVIGVIADRLVTRTTGDRSVAALTSVILPSASMVPAGHSLDGYAAGQSQRLFDL